MCTRTDHDRIRRDSAAWLADTTPLGVQRFDDEGPDLLLANCRQCRSTLAREMPAEVAS